MCDENIIKSANYINGSVPVTERQAIVQRFQAGQIKVLSAVTQTIATGYTLDKADVAIFMDIYPPAVDWEQAKDRMVPTDASMVKQRCIYRLMMGKTFDEECYRMVKEHLSRSDVVNNFRRYVYE